MEQIARFYARHLTLSREMAKNLQSFAEGSSCVVKSAVTDQLEECYRPTGKQEFVCFAFISGHRATLRPRPALGHFPAHTLQHATFRRTLGTADPKLGAYQRRLANAAYKI